LNKWPTRGVGLFYGYLSTQSNAFGAVGANASFALSLLRKQGQHFRAKHSIHTPAALGRGSSGSSLFHGASIWRLAYGALGGVNDIHCVKRITLNGCVQGRATQLLQGFLSPLCLLPVALNFECVAGTFAGGTQLVQSQLLWFFGFLKLEDSHAFIYGDG
jgi:hypothetical protein